MIKQHYSLNYLILPKVRGVRALRVQSDKIAYSQTMRNKLKALEKLDIVEDQVLDLLIKDHQIYGVKTDTNL